MSSIPVNIAVEDELSEIVLRRLLRDVDRGYCIGTAYRQGGYGYLKKTVKGWNRAAVSIPFVVLTDLDRALCPAELIRDWMMEPLHPNLVLRVAVKEVESWLLADSRGLAEYLQIRTSSFPERPDEIQDPKATLIALSRASRSLTIKSSIVPKARSTAKQGPDYNACLSMFVAKNWSLESAVAKSPSLRRAIDRFSKFTPTWA